MTVQDWKEAATISAAFLTPVTAILTVIIAWQQLRTNRDGERRESRHAKLAVYRRVKLLLRHALYSPTLDTSLYSDFCDACAEAEFLFDADLRAWLHELEDVAAHCMSIQEPLGNLSSMADVREINRIQGELDEETEKIRAASYVLREKFAKAFR